MSPMTARRSLFPRTYNDVHLTRSHYEHCPHGYAHCPDEYEHCEDDYENCADDCEDCPDDYEHCQMEKQKEIVRNKNVNENVQEGVSDSAATFGCYTRRRRVWCLLVLGLTP